MFPQWLGRARVVAMLRADLEARSGHLAEADALVEAASPSEVGLRASLVALRVARGAHTAGHASSAARFEKLVALEERCLDITFDFDQPCRIAAAEARVTLAEEAASTGNVAAARAHLARLRALWPRADEELDIVTRARALERALP